MTKEGSMLENGNSIGKEPDQPVAIRSNRLDREGMNFTLYKANGGYVMEMRVYDRKTDRNDNKLHIITADQDLGQAIAHIITFEALQQ